MKIKINDDEVKLLLTAIDNLIDIKVLLRQITPNYSLDENLNKRLEILLESLHKKLQPIFNKYLDHTAPKDSIKEQKEKTIKLITDLIKEQATILISTNSNKKKLKKLGADPRKLIVTGGPLLYQDYQKINPNLSKESLIVIKEKCENLLYNLKDLEKDEKVVFLFNETNLTDQIILNELKSIESKLNIKIDSFPLFF